MQQTLLNLLIACRTTSKLPWSNRIATQLGTTKYLFKSITCCQQFTFKKAIRDKWSVLKCQSIASIQGINPFLSQLSTNWQSNHRHRSTLHISSLTNLWVLLWNQRHQFSHNSESSVQLSWKESITTQRKSMLDTFGKCASKPNHLLDLTRKHFALYAFTSKLLRECTLVNYDR